MRKWESLVEQKIREAMDQGEFQHLPGKGRPLDLARNPYEPPSMRLANMMLQANGFAPPWIEERKTLDTAIDDAVSRLRNAWTAIADEAGPTWKIAVEHFLAEAAELNRRVLTYNLKAPSSAFHRPQVDAEREIARVRQAGL